jgi:hypothetical protein
MSRRILLLCGLCGALAFPAGAAANDASMVRAIAPYRNALEADVISLAAFNNIPAKSTLGSWNTKLVRAQRDTANAARVMRAQSPSTSSGSKAKSNVLIALSDAYAAAGDGLAAIHAIQGNRIASARSDIAREQHYIAASIPPFSAAGKALGLFNG